LLPSGDYKGRISLGAYSAEKRALARVSRANAMGIDVEIVERYKDRTAYWLNLSLTGLPEAEIELQTVASNIAPSASVERTSCHHVDKHALGILKPMSWGPPKACAECAFSVTQTDCKVKHFFAQMNISFLQSMNGSL